MRSRSIGLGVAAFNFLVGTTILLFDPYLSALDIFLIVANYACVVLNVSGAFR